MLTAEREMQALNAKLDIANDTLNAQERLLDEHNLALPAMGRRRADPQKTRPIIYERSK